MAVSIMTKIIPDEYRVLENISWTPTSDNKWNLVSDLTNVNNTKYKFIVGNDLSGNEIEKDITGNSDDTFTFDVSYQYVFCYGKEVDDFHALDKNKIFALHHSAIQELDKQIQVMGCSDTTDDPRTQTNCADANTSSALDTLRLLKPKTFEYIDTINNTGQTVYGFDSNQVKQVVPYATKNIQNKIPNIYRKASVLTNKIIFTDFNVNNLTKDASNNLYSKLIVLDANDQEHEVTIKKIVNDYCIETNINLQSFVREDSSVANCIFVYGQILDNVEQLSKDYIWSISTTALQEVDKQLQEEKTKNTELSNKVNVLTNETNNNKGLLETIQTELENKINAIQTEYNTKHTTLYNEVTLLKNELTLEKIKNNELETKLNNFINSE